MAREGVAEERTLVIIEWNIRHAKQRHHQKF